MEGTVQFAHLGCSTTLVTTSTGHVGFHILHDLPGGWHDRVNWTTASEAGGSDVFFGKQEGVYILLRTGTGRAHDHPCSLDPEPLVYMGGL